MSLQLVVVHVPLRLFLQTYPGFHGHFCGHTGVVRPCTYASTSIGTLARAFVRTVVGTFAATQPLGDLPGLRRHEGTTEGIAACI